jgi:hypothetical protein
MHRLLFSLWSVISILFTQAQPFLQTPIEGQPITDWVIVNYVDWEANGIKDHQCLTKTYDGHQGTDYTLHSFAQMDTGVNVLAAADGVVTFVQDGLFDREKESVIAKGLGNYVAIAHSNKYYTYYGHLRKNSITVTEGQNVKAGDVIGEVGSSGNSTDPHLHFEVWYDSSFVVDPYAGSCGNPTTLFNNPTPYDSAFRVGETGFSIKTALSMDDLRERRDLLSQPFNIAPSSEDDLYYWAQLYGVREGKDVTVRWYTPNDVEWFSFTATADRDYWYYYFWTYIFHEDLEPGKWKAVLEYDGNAVKETSFTVNQSAAVKPLEIVECQEYQSIPIPELVQNPRLDVQIYDVAGKHLDFSAHEPLASGYYILSVQSEHTFCRLKRFIE